MRGVRACGFISDRLQRGAQLSQFRHLLDASSRHGEVQATVPALRQRDILVVRRWKLSTQRRAQPQHPLGLCARRRADLLR